MEYCSPVWAGGSSTDLALLDRVQRRALWTCGIDPDNDRLCRQLAVQPLSHRRGVSSLCILHQMVSGVAPGAMTAHCPTYFTAPRTSRSATDAHPYRLTVSRSRTSRQAASFLQKTVRKWNDLPPSILSGQLQSLDHFKAQVNQLDLSLF